MKRGIWFFLLSGMSLACQPQVKSPETPVLPPVEQVAVGHDESMRYDGATGFDIETLEEYQLIADSLHLEYADALAHDSAQRPANVHEYPQAIRAGIHGADLFYAYLCKKPVKALDHFWATHRIFEALKIAPFFDMTALRISFLQRSVGKKWHSLAGNRFSKVHRFYAGQRKENLVALMGAGFAIEQTYLLCQAYRKHNSELLRDKIGLQQVTFDHLVFAFHLYEERWSRNNHSRILYARLKELVKIYRSVVIRQDVSHVHLVEKNGEFIIEAGTKTTASISPQQIDRITELVTQLRNSMIRNEQLSVSSYQ